MKINETYCTYKRCKYMYFLRYENINTLTKLQEHLQENLTVVASPYHHVSSIEFPHVTIHSLISHPFPNVTMIGII